MIALILSGIVLALIALVVYYVRRNSITEIEKAALENSKTASNAKVELLENERLKLEADAREAERRAVQAFEDMDDRPEFGDGKFYPRVRPDKDRLN